MTEIKLIIGSVTYAMKAKGLLSRKGLHPRLIKQTRSEDGCTYGVCIPEYELMAAAALLREAQISYEVFRS